MRKVALVLLVLLVAGCGRPAAMPSGETPVTETAPSPPPAPVPAPEPSPAPEPAPAAEPVTPVLPSGPDVTAVDGDKDGKAEFHIRGRLGEWHKEPLTLYDAEGRPLEYTFGQGHPQVRHRADVVAVAGVPEPALVYHMGEPDSVHWISLRFWRDGKLLPVYGVHHKTDQMIGSDLTIEPDGTLVLAFPPQDVGGYTWVRRYRVAENRAKDWPPFQATLLAETLTAGPYPTEPAHLLTAAFVAHWYNLPADLARYVPDQAVRQTIQAQERFTRPPYRPSRAEVGKVAWKTVQNLEIPELVEPAPLAADGSTEFLVRIGQYEGFFYWAGQVTFRQAEDGRLIVSRIRFEKSDFVY